MHEHPSTKGQRYLGISLGITFSFFVIELLGGLFTNSLALLTDSWHMLNDVFALALSLIAAWIAQRPLNAKKTYGYYRAEILAAFLQGILLWAIVLFMFYEALLRIQQPVEVMSLNMLVIAFLGLGANGFSAAILSKSRDESLNIKGAFLHVVADILGSVAAISAGVIMLFTGWYQADPLISMLIGALIFYSAGKVVRESLNVLLEGVPSNIDLKAIEQRMLEVKGIRSIHDLHVWCITPTRMCMMSGHVVLDGHTERKEMTSKLIRMLKDEFGIDHTTIQLEDEGYPKAPGEHSETAT
jgi:cobalt-zinc-cadmium efflux system protein